MKLTVDFAYSNKLPQSMLPKLMEAGNAAIKSGRELAIDSVGARKALQRKRIGKGVKASSSKSLTWTLTASGKAMPLIEYPARQVAAGVMATVNVGQAKLVKSAFVATMKSGHTGVFVRDGLPRRRVGPNRHDLPIKELFSTRISWAVGDDKEAFFERVLEIIRAQLGE